MPLPLPYYFFLTSSPLSPVGSLNLHSQFVLFSGKQRHSQPYANRSFTDIADVLDTTVIRPIFTYQHFWED